MTRSTSEVAVCCSSNSVRSSVRWRSSVSSRVFSIAMTACAAKFFHELYLFIGERPDLQAVDRDGSDQIVAFEHRHGEYTFARPPSSRSARAVGIARSVSLHVSDMHRPLACERRDRDAISAWRGMGTANSLLDFGQRCRRIAHRAP